MIFLLCFFLYSIFSIHFHFIYTFRFDFSLSFGHFCLILIILVSIYFVSSQLYLFLRRKKTLSFVWIAGVMNGWGVDGDFIFVWFFTRQSQLNPPECDLIVSFVFNSIFIQYNFDINNMYVCVFWWFVFLFFWLNIVWSIRFIMLVFFQFSIFLLILLVIFPLLIRVLSYYSLDRF